MAEAIFNIEDVSVNLIKDGTPIDISSGLIIDGDFIEIEKESRDETTTRRGTGDEYYTANAINDTSRLITLRYVPSAAAVKVLQQMRKTRSAFGIVVRSNTSPKFVLMASSCVFTEEPGTKINGKSGFGDYEFKIRANDSQQEWL